MKKYLCILLSFAMLLPMLLIPASAAEMDNIKNVAALDETCPEIHIGETVTVDIENGGDIAFLIFVPETDMRICFYSDSDYDTYGRIFDEDFEQLASNDDGWGRNFKIKYKVKANEVYYLGAEFFSSEDVGSFNVILEENPSATLDDSYPEIHLGETVTVDIENGGDIAYLGFVPETDMKICFYSDSDYDTYGWLFDEDFVELAFNDDGWDRNFSISYDVEANEVYYFGAKFFDYDDVGSFDVILKEDTSTPTEYEEPTEEEPTEQLGFEYQVLENGTIEITNYKGNDSEIIVPNTINGYTVTGIGNASFSMLENLERVIITNTVTYIDSGAFYYCNNLNEVILGANLNTIGEEAFIGCASLESIELPESVQVIGNSAFAYCYALKSITIPEGVTVIEEGTFFDCKSMESITLPKTIQEIGEVAIGFDMTEKGEDPVPKSNFTICGYQGTVAQTYAEDHGFTFCALDEIADRQTGDADGDGIITIMDASDIQHLIMTSAEVDASSKPYVDVDKNGLIEVIDATYIQRSVAEIGIPYTVGNKKGTELIKSVKEISYSESGEKMGENEFIYDYIFDEKGNAVQQTNMNGGYSQYVYNDEGIIIKWSRYNSDGVLFWETEYNDDGLKICDSYYLNHYVYTTEYDDHKNQTRHTCYKDGILDYDMTTEYEYDVKSNIVKQTEYHNNSLIIYYLYEYDNNNHMNRREDYDSDGKKLLTTYYVFDEKGNMRSYISVDDYGVDSASDYWYDNNNNLIFSNTDNGRWQDKVIYTYDASGYLTKKSRYENGILKNQTEITYYK